MMKKDIIDELMTKLVPDNILTNVSSVLPTSVFVISTALSTCYAP